MTATGSELMNTYQRSPVRFVSGRGARLVDSEGREYIDFLAGIAVASVGHAHPRVAEAVAAQVRELVHVSNLFETAPQQQLARRLAGLTNGMHSFFCNSGAEAIEAALKLARKHARVEGRAATRIVCAEGGFHGRTFGALSATGQPSKQAPFVPLVEGFSHVAFGDADALARAVDHDVAAVLLEPIQGEAGVVVPPSGYLAKARSLCDEVGALLVVDEVQTGLGRTGAWFGFQHDGVTPDVICLAKALAGGLPMGACLARPEVAASFVPGDHASTFGGGPVQSAAALATLDVIESEGLVERAARAGGRLESALGEVFPGAEVRGRGLLLAVEFSSEIANEIVRRALGAGLILNATAANTLRFAPPLVITDDELERGLHILQEVTDAVHATT
ncbi:MAG: acetylornithine transaminase [Actinomycetota bacterium]